MDSLDHVRDRVALVTGAARGIGKAIATALCRAGAKVALADILPQELEATAEELGASGSVVFPVVVDVTQPEQVDAMVAQVAQELGPIDILVNNAGTFSYIGPVWEADPDTWFRDTRVNLFGVFLCCRAVVARMVTRGQGGYVINIATTGGMNGPHAYSTSYACSKVAQVRLTEALAKEAEPHGVKVFAVGPPAIQTEMTRFIATDPGGKKWRPGFKKLLQPGAGHPPELIADLVLKLLSGRADRLSGRYFNATHDFDEIVTQTEDTLDQDLLVLRLRGCGSEL